MTRIIAISDTHSQHHKLEMPEGDILIHCGDISNLGSKQEIERFLEWLANQDYKHKIFIAGNHDFWLEFNQVRGMLPDDTYYLQDSSVKVDGLLVWGSPWTSPFGEWAFQRVEAGREDAFSKIPNDTNILVTHSPPAGRGDLTWFDDRIGCHILARHVDRVQPRLHLFGHCHYGYGVSVDGRWANCASVGEDYRIANPPVVIDL